MSDIRYILRKDGEAERAAVMWSWGDRLSPEVIREQIKAF